MTSLNSRNGTAGWDVVLADGSTAHIRPVSPEDGPEIADLHARLSPETVRLRYLGAHPRLSAAELALLVEEEVVRRHDPARKEVAAHPVVGRGVLEGVEELAVAEDVDEQLPAGP